MPSRKKLKIRIGKVSLYQHHGAWWIYYRERKRPIRQRVSADRSRAEQIASEIHLRLQQGQMAPVLIEECSSSEITSRFLQHHEHVLYSSLNTVTRYKNALQHEAAYLATCRSGDRLSKIKVSEFLAYLRQLRVAPNGHSNTASRPLRDKGIKYIIDTCRAKFEFARRQGLIPKDLENPYREQSLIRIRISDAKPIFLFNAATEVKFLEYCPTSLLPIFFCLAKTGMRSDELCHLLWEDIDLSTGWISIRNKPELGWSIKTRNERHIPLIPELKDLIGCLASSRRKGLIFIRCCASKTFTQLTRKEMETNLQERIRSIEELSGTQIDRLQQHRLAKQLWKDCGAWDPDQIRRRFLAITKKCGWPEATCVKSFRHTFATLLQLANVDPLVRQLTMGHSPQGGNGALGMTAVYTHTQPEFHSSEICRASLMWPESLEIARNATQPTQ